MTKHGCHNGSLDETKYSSPVPIIGLYVAAASVVCMLLMLYDIVRGFLSRKRWLPCRAFTLNSVTLTLLSIAAKLPVDLTTPMPGALDQLSKLSGTTLLCICIGFLMPSLGTNRHSENLTNIAAMGVFFITVAVNICMQMYTGVIFMFIAEHIAILVFMLILLMLLWSSALDINFRKGNSVDLSKDLLKKGEKSMFKRLKMCYVYGYSSNPGFVMCKHPTCTTVGVLCLLCSTILMQAVYKSLISKRLGFCIGISDYDWSMWIIVVTQILTVIVGGFATSFRLITMFHLMNLEWLGPPEYWDYIFGSPILGMDSRDRFSKYTKTLVIFLVFVVQGFVIILFSHLGYNIVRFFSPTCFGIYKHKYRNNGDNGEMKEYKDLVRVGNVELNDYSVWKSVEDMKKWMGGRKTKSLSRLSEFLSRTLPSRQIHTMELIDPAYPNQKGMEASSLSIVLLVRIAQLCFPNTLGESLGQVFSEASETVRFIDKSINTSSYKNATRTRLASSVCLGKDFACLDGVTHSQNLSGAISSITALRGALPRGILRDELDAIVDFLIHRSYASTEDLCSFVQQLFVDVLHVLLAQLPNAIFQSVTESPIEEYEEKVRLALKCLSEIEELETKIQWSFPIGCNILSLITTKAPATHQEDNADVRINFHLMKDDFDPANPSTVNDMFSLNKYEWD